MTETQGQQDEGLRQRLGGQLVRHTTVSDTVLNTIREAILRGRLAPGERLNQDALASTLGVSRMPVRSALMQLESEGLVSFHPHRGAVVRMLTAHQIREIYDLRIVLEEYALREVIGSIPEDRLERLEKLAIEMDEEQNGELFLQQRLSFYRELYDEEARPLLVSILERLREDVGRYWIRLRVVDKQSQEHNHMKLVEFVRAGNPDAAVRWRSDHLRRVRDELASRIGQSESSKEESEETVGPLGQPRTSSQAANQTPS